MLALTATASPLVRQEILERLELRDPVEIVQGFDRPNLHLSAYSFHEKAAKTKALLGAIAESTPPGIVYVATRKAAEELSEALIAQNINAAAYHAGLSSKQRDEIQDRFMADEIDVIVATNAFGMGIDKPNVRFVYHYHIPGSVDAYYQEIGRAGRDGEPADIKLFYRPDDMKLQRFFTSGGSVDEATLLDLAQLIEAAPESLTEDQLLKHSDLSQAKLATALENLEAVGLIERGAEGEIEVILGVLADQLIPVPIYYSWRPQLTDSDDEMVSECAINAQAEAIITFNKKDFLSAALQFRVEVLNPGKLVRKLGLVENLDLVEAEKTRRLLQRYAQNADYTRFDAILDRVPNVPPVEGDEL